MILQLDHVSIIASSEATIRFYEKLGFKSQSCIDRGYDKLYYLTGYGITLEIYVDSNHPPRVDRPEAMGLRHLAFQVDDIEESIKKWDIEAEPIRENNGYKFTFVRDPDLTPIELKELI